MYTDPLPCGHGGGEGTATSVVEVVPVSVLEVCEADSIDVGACCAIVS